MNDYSHLDVYRKTAQVTRNRRQAAGRYTKPTQAQVSAFKKSLARNGRDSLTQEEVRLLSTHPYLHESQRAEYAAMVVA